MFGLHRGAHPGAGEERDVLDRVDVVPDTQPFVRGHRPVPREGPKHHLRRREGGSGGGSGGGQ